jgi:hypothetical protein
VACPAVSQCTAVDQSGNEVTFNPQSPGTPTPAPIDGTTPVNGIDCPSSTQCTAVDSAGKEITFNPTAPGTPTPTTIDGTNGINSVSCPSSTQCTAVDGKGQEVTFNPQSAGTASAVALPDANAMTGIACNSTIECLAVDSVGDGFAGFTAPANTAPPTITGSTVEGQGLTATLTLHQGTWTGAGLTIKDQWLRCDSAGNNCAAINGATGPTYTLTSADLNHTIRVAETATNPAGSASVNSAQTPLVTLKPIGSLSLLSTKLKVAKGRVQVPFLCNSYLQCDGNFSITLRVKSAKTHRLVTIVCTKSSQTFFRIKAGARRTLKVPVLKSCAAQIKAAKHHTVKGKLSSRPRTGQLGVIKGVKLHT